MGDAPGALPFDAPKLDSLLEESNIAGLLATSPHNVRYLLGGYRFFLYERLDPIGPSRYAPIVGYVAADSKAAFYVGAGNEDWGTDAVQLWVPSVLNAAWATTDSARIAAEQLRARGLGRERIGIEPAFLSADAMAVLEEELPEATFVEVTDALEELRAVKSAAELEIVRSSAEGVVDAMVATFSSLTPGMSKRDAVERLRREETDRGLVFGYCLVAAGRSHNRAPSDQVLQAGDSVSLDSAADSAGYTADLARMGVLGEPSDRHRELLDQIAAVQATVRAAVKPGELGGRLFEVAAAAIAEQPAAAEMTFLAHGTGLLTHEAPRMTSTGSPPYPATHAERPLEAGMVLSVETHIADPEAGFVKLEDTVIVTPEGNEGVGDHGRGWNRSDNGGVR
jgi:Xaa-Pro aminopeptidase